MRIEPPPPPTTHSTVLLFSCSLTILFLFPIYFFFFKKKAPNIQYVSFIKQIQYTFFVPFAKVSSHLRKNCPDSQSFCCYTTMSVIEAVPCPPMRTWTRNFTMLSNAAVTADIRCARCLQVKKNTPGTRFICNASLEMGVQHYSGAV